MLLKNANSLLNKTSKVTLKVPGNPQLVDKTTAPAPREGSQNAFFTTTFQTTQQVLETKKVVTTTDLEVSAHVVSAEPKTVLQLGQNIGVPVIRVSMENHPDLEMGLELIYNDANYVIITAPTIVNDMAKFFARKGTPSAR